MKIEIQTDENCSETKIIIVTDKITDEISDLLQMLSAETRRKIVGYADGSATILEAPNIVRVYACNGKIYAETHDKEYQLHARLYEVEEQLNKNAFVKISQSEIVNLKCIEKFDLNLTGTIRVFLCNGKISYVSRRYVSKIKTTLGI